MSDNQQHWTRKAWQGLLLLLLIAIGARVVYGLLVPLLPAIAAGIVLASIFMLLFQRR